MTTENPIPSLFSEVEKFRRWTEIEIHAANAIGPDHIPVGVPGHVPSPQEVAIRETVTDHDVAAFVDCLQERVGMGFGPLAMGQIHNGLTSSDIVDTALCWTIRDALTAVRRRFRERPDWDPLDRDYGRIGHAQSAIAVCKLSGAVGTYGNVHPDVEAYVCRQLGLVPIPGTQVVPRDLHAEVVFACALVAPSVRHWVPVALENVSLWHERDISHSAVERIMIPEVLTAAWEAANA